MNGFNNFNNLENKFDFMFTIVPIFIGVVFMLVIGVFIIMLVPKFRSKLFGAHIKSTRMILDDNKDILKDLSSDITQTKKEFLEENEEILKEIKRREAEINNEETKVKAKTIKDIFSDTMYCKHCGASIAKDSKYCNICGKKL